MTGRPGNPRTRVQFLHPPLIFKVNGIGFFIHFTSVSFSLNKSVATHVYLFHLLGQGGKRWRESLFITPLKVGWLSLPFPLRTHIHRTKTLKISFELGLTYIKALTSFIEFLTNSHWFLITTLQCRYCYYHYHSILQTRTLKHRKVK